MIDNQTKDSLYSLLDLLDSLSNMNFLTPNIDKINSLRTIILSTISEKKELNKNSFNISNSILELQKFLSNKKNFKYKSDLVGFAEKFLDSKSIELVSKKSAMDDMINKILICILEMDENTQIEILLKTNFFISSQKPNDKNNKKISKKGDHSNFMNTWFNFFENYEG